MKAELQHINPDGSVNLFIGNEPSPEYIIEFKSLDEVEDFAARLAADVDELRQEKLKRI